MAKNESITILYVEDQDDVRLFLHKILSRHYTHVFLAKNGKEGLDFYRENKPDIIISDIKMPVMDGLSMSSRIKETDPNAKIILTTAHSDMEYFIQSIDIGINQYILKPIDREKLFNAIKICADQVLMEKEIEEKNKDLVKTNEKLVAQERELRENLQKTIALKELISKNEMNFRQLAENVQDAIWLTTPEKVLYVNKSFEKIFEIQTAELYDKPHVFLQFVHPDDKNQFLTELQKHEKLKSGSFSSEFRILLNNDVIRNLWYRDIFISGQNETEKEKRRVVVITDISWQKENEKLQKELVLSEKSLDIKRQFLTNISHEMRTPLNGIISMADILLGTSLDHNQSDYARIIKESGDSLLEIINDLLSISEIEQGKLIFVPGKIDVKKILNSSIFQQAKKKADGKGLFFRTHLPENFPDHFYSDKEKVNQVVKNLISNALKFTFTGGIDIFFEAIDLNKQQWEIIITVQDSGIGIKKENASKIFQLFSQQESSDSRTYDGLGLGLTVCKNLSEFLHGKISLDTCYTKGSRFVFSFPANKFPHNTKEANAENLEVKDKVPQINAKILYAEDKIVNQKVISIILENAGCIVDIAENGEKALEMSQQDQYDIILMDIQMPVMDGITSTQKIKKSLGDSTPPVIAVSANAINADAQFYLSKGLDDYITKPVSSTELYNRIIYWLEKSSSNNNKDSARTVENLKNEVFTDERNKSETENLPDLDIETLNTLKEQTQNDMQLVEDLYLTFVQEAEGLIGNMKNVLENQQNDKIREYTHALKGLSATVGAGKMYDITFRMDALHKKGVFEQTEDLFHDLTNAFENVKDQIQQMFNA
ncbi:MAG: response regulator [Bacteroidota bacterium]